MLMPYGERKEIPFLKELTIQVKKQHSNEKKSRSNIKSLTDVQHNNTRDSFTRRHMSNCPIIGAIKFRGRKNIQKAGFKLDIKRQGRRVWMGKSKWQR